MNGLNSTKRRLMLAPQGYLGVALLVICWPLNWSLPGVRTAYLFFPLWLGYILVVDALVAARTGSSLWQRSRRDFILLFLASAPVWWIFEVINQRTGNWEYRGSRDFTQFEYYALCTISFSTVMPAVFETAEWVRSFRWVERFAAGVRVRPARWLNAGLFLAGLIMAALTFVFPKYCYPFVWTALVLILEPLNCWMGRPHLLQDLKRGDWRPVIVLAAGALICGFFWEMWNYYSDPKWYYHTPGAQFLHVFEMPLLGYCGYLPFGLELYALRNFLWPRPPRLAIGD